MLSDTVEIFPSFSMASAKEGMLVVSLYVSVGCCQWVAALRLMRRFLGWPPEGSGILETENFSFDFSWMFFYFDIRLVSCTCQKLQIMSWSCEGS